MKNPVFTTLTLAEFGDFIHVSALQKVSEKLAGDVAQEEAPQSSKSIARRQRIAKLAEHNLNDEELDRDSM